MMAMTILNLLQSPSIMYNAQINDIYALRSLIILQTVFQLIYLIDLVVMILIFGFRSVLLEQSLGLRLEILIQFFFVYQLVFDWGHVYTTNFDETREELKNYAEFAAYFNAVLLIRMIRIFTFLNELEQWKFFTRTLKVLKGPFFNLTFTLYSLYFFYTLLGQHIYGGKITTRAIAKLFYLNPDFDASPDYMWLNFNDFLSGLITLFSMQLFNNWQFIWDQFNFVIDNWIVSALFFFSFMLMSTYVIINILMAFIIDVYTSIEV